MATTSFVGNQLQPSPTKQSEIPYLVDMLNEGVSSLESSLYTLIDKLGPVLATNPETEGGSQQAALPVITPLGKSIDQIGSRIANNLNLINATIKRLEL